MFCCQNFSRFGDEINKWTCTHTHTILVQSNVFWKRWYGRGRRPPAWAPYWSSSRVHLEPLWRGEGGGVCKRKNLKWTEWRFQCNQQQSCCCVTRKRRGDEPHICLLPNQQHREIKGQSSRCWRCRVCLLIGCCRRLPTDLLEMQNTENTWSQCFLVSATLLD